MAHAALAWNPLRMCWRRDLQFERQMRETLNLWSHRNSISIREFVTQSLHVQDEPMTFRGILKLLAHPRNINIHGASVRCGFVTPPILEHLLAGNSFSAMLDKVPE